MRHMTITQEDEISFVIVTQGAHTHTMSLRIHVKMFTMRNAGNTRICTEINGRSHNRKYLNWI